VGHFQKFSPRYFLIRCVCTDGTSIADVRDCKSKNFFNEEKNMGWQKFFSFVLAGFITTASCFADGGPQIVNVELNKSYIPIGFDDNDRGQVVVAGMFPNSCYKVGPYRVVLDEVNKTLAIAQTALLYQGQCIQVLVPFTQTIDIGILREGSYAIKDHFSGKALGAMPVARAKVTEADDFLYAPVTDAQVQTEEGKSTLYLQGNFTDRCTHLKDVVVSYYDDVLVVQPIAEHIATNDCGHQMIRFQYEMPLKEGLTGSRLVHVRVMDGQAINRIAEFGK